MTLIAHDLRGKDREDLLLLAKEAANSVMSKQADIDRLIFALADEGSGDGQQIADLLDGCWQPFDDVDSYCETHLASISADRELAAKKRKQKEAKGGKK